MRPSFIRSLSALSAATALATALDASAQDVATAEAQFDRGLEEMKAGRFDVGCPALAESLRLDPRPGTLFTLADCEARWGHIATAMARYEDYLSLYARMTPEQQGKQQGREAIVAARKEALASRVPRLTLVPPAGAPAGLVVRRGDVALAAPSLDVALPVDPGEHVVVVEAPGRAARSIRIRIEPGEARRIVLELGPPLPAPVAEERRPVTPASPAAEGISGQRVAAFGALGLGIASLGVGAVSGALTLGHKGTVDDHCEGEVCDGEGFAATESAATTGLVSTITFGVGAAAVAAGIVLLVTEPDEAHPAVGVAIGPSRVGIVGSFR